MLNIPKTTLFMISSLDGKISSGDTDSVDVDRDWKRVKGVREGLGQYYELEKHTDIFSFNTGRVMQKIGINSRTNNPKKILCTFVLVDNQPHLNEKGLHYLSNWLRHVIIVTTNKKHPAFAMEKAGQNISVIYYPSTINFINLFEKLKRQYGVNRLTVQSGGTMNATLIRAGLIDRISLVTAPLLVGGKTTPTLMDGEAIHSVSELNKLKPLKLLEMNKLKNSYINLVYKVLPKTVIVK
jgi:2,5-diamino-6-(ribosylamino)-4(3H)-pyrimidinone 5'-phosphate reductase